jgi:hypothetical protein
MTRVITTVCAVTVAFVATLIAPSRAAAQSPDVVVAWNQVLQTVSPLLWRPYAMVHVAMFDAINSIEKTYTPYHVQVPASRGASREAAAAQAARDVLVALFPANEQMFDALLASQLNGIAPGLSRQGETIGSQVAEAILEWRQDDGWPQVVAPDPGYVLPTFPGLWQPTPPGFSPPTLTFYSDVRPFGLLSSTQFLPPPPPALNSERYAADFNEVKQLGAAASAVRTVEETLLAELFAGVNTTTTYMGVWNNVARDVASAHGLSLADTARLFALMNVSFHDGLQTSFTSKFAYQLWRPVTAVRRADEDLNDSTEADAVWTPLLTTPPYPSYAGNASCLAAASARSVALILGRDDLAFSVTWARTGGLPDETRFYTALSQLIEEQARSRIYGGIHFQFDSDASEAVCPQVAEYIFTHFMRPR